MTTYRYDISLNDSECIAIEAALEIYVDYCKAKIAKDEKVPCLAHLQVIEKLQDRICRNGTQTSGYSRLAEMIDGISNLEQKTPSKPERSDLAFHFHGLVQIPRTKIFGDKSDYYMPLYLHEDSNTMFAGYVGPDYKQGEGVVILGINPGGGGDSNKHRSQEDEKFYPLLHAFKNAEHSEIVEAFEAINAAFVPIVKKWNLWRILEPTLQATGLDIEEVAYLNIVPYRTRSNKMPPVHAQSEAWAKIVAPTQNMLRPRAVISLGKKTWNVANRFIDSGIPHYCVPRTNGDTYVSKDAIDALEKIKLHFNTHPVSESELVDIQDFERVIRKLTTPVNGQYPRPWMTKLADPHLAEVFIVGKNQSRNYATELVGSHDRHIDALFNRNGENCRGLYDEITGRSPSPTRENIDAFVQKLEQAGVNKILETNVVCYSTPMSADLKKKMHIEGAKQGEEIFRYLLKEIDPRVIIVHGAGAKKQLVKMLGVGLGEIPEHPDDLSMNEVEGRLVVVIPSLAPPESNKWKRWAPEHLEAVAKAVASRIKE